MQSISISLVHGRDPRSEWIESAGDTRARRQMMSEDTPWRRARVGPGTFGRRALARRLWYILRWPALLAFGLWNAGMLLGLVPWLIQGLPQNDWSLFIGLDHVAPFATRSFHWAPLAAWVWVGLVQPLGFGLWTVLHFIALAAIRDRTALVVFATFPFWHDVVSGNVMTFVLVAAWWALRGNRAGIVAFCLLAALIPRPLMLPVLAWLLWRHPFARWAFAASAGLVVLTALSSGDLGPWLGVFTHLSGEITADFNLAPSRSIGLAWLLVAWPVAAWAFWRGYLGLASVLMAPYVIGYYLVMLGLDLAKAQREVAALGRHRARVQATVDA